MPLQKNCDKLVNEYFSALHAGVETADIVGHLMTTILSDPDLKNRDYHLGALLSSNVTNASIEYIKNLTNAVLAFDHFENKQITLSSQKNQKIVTVAGSGKKGLKTINISTPSVMAAASFGAQVVKPCSRSTSSLTGSSDFFTYLGGKLNDVDQTCKTFYRTGVGLFSIEGMIPQFDSIYGGKALSPTVLSYVLSAIVNPIKTDTVLYGLSLPNVEKSLYALQALGYRTVMVSNTTDDQQRYVDEIGAFHFNNLILRRSTSLDEPILRGDPVDMMGVQKRYSLNEISQRRSIRENVMCTVDVLKGKGNSVHQEIIAMNTAAILYLANTVEDLREGYLQAKRELLSGRPFEKLQEVITSSGGQCRT